MEKITSIVYNKERFDVFYISRKVCPIVTDEENVIACCSQANRLIYVFDEFIKLSEDSKYIILLHEVAHLNGIKSNIEADIFVLHNTTITKFITALHEIRDVLFKSKPTKHKEIADFINDRINTFVHKDIS